jgi:hypothetical protein
MTDKATRNKTHRTRGLLIAGVSLAALLGLALLKGRADSGSELD